MRICTVYFAKIFVIIVFMSVLSITASAQVTEGVIEGTVYDASTEEVLPGVNISLEGSGKGTATDSKGRFVLRNLPEGDYMMVVSYVGYATREIEVEVDDDEIELEDYDIEVDIDEVVEIEIYLEPGEELDEIRVTGYRRGQQQALNQQKMSNTIENVVSSELLRSFPDDNTAEALQRIPGISIERDQGEGRYVQIRGASPGNNNISFNGEQIASPEGDLRAVAMDVIPSNMLSSMEVTKAITPDMEGSAIGGSINLNTLQAPSDGRILELSFGPGYNNNAKYLSPLYGKGAFTFGQRFGDDQKLGFVIGSSYNVRNLSTDNNEMEYSDTELGSIVLQDDEITRTRLGITSTIDYRFSEESNIYLSGIFNKFGDQEFSRASVVEPDVIERELKDRFESQTVMNISGGGRHLLNDSWEIDYKLSYSYSEQNTPREYVTIFVQEHDGDFMDLTPDDKYPQFSVRNDAPAGAGLLSYDMYESDEFEFSRELTTDQHYTSRFNLSKLYNVGNASGIFKFGGLARSKSKDLDPDKTFYTYEGDKTYRDLLGSFEDTEFFNNQYEVGRTFSPQKMRDLFENERPNFDYNAEDTFIDSRAEDYDATENTFAGYAMTDLQLGDLTAIVGARYENISTKYEGSSVEFDENGDLIPEAVPQEGDRNFGFFLPMAHLKYQPSENINVRLGWTNTYSLPSYFDLAPYRIVDRGANEIELGNPDLEATRSMNWDLMLEYYFSEEGAVSGGVYYKDIQDFRYVRLFINDSGEFEGYETEQPVSGDEAEVLGLEVSLQQQLSFLPGFASGFGFFANYTYSWSEATLFGETENEFRTGPLPGQSEQVGNVALSYQYGGFTGRLSANYNAPFITSVRENEESDRYHDKHLQFDFSATQEITSRIGVYLELLNITNEPQRFYNGVSSRPEQQEYYSWWANAGVKLQF